MAKNHSGRPAWLKATGVGVEFAGAVAGFTLVGYWIDRKYETSPWGVLIGVSLGLVGGMYNMVRDSLAVARRSEQERHEGDGGAA